MTRFIRSEKPKLLFYRPRNNPRNARVTLSPEDEGTVSKNNLTRNYLGNKAYMGRTTLHPLLALTQGS